MTPAGLARPGAGAEEELLLLCARAHLDEGAAERTAALARGAVDWQRVGEMAERHRVAPLLLAHLNAVAPPSATAALRVSSQERLRHGLALAGALLQALDLLERAGIPALAYKGPALSQILYRSPALRPICDLDLLVAPPNVWGAAEALRAAGFHARHDYTPRQRAAYLRTEDEYNLYRDDGAIVEIHWELIPRARSPLLATKSVLCRSATVEIAGRPVPTLSPEDHLFFLTVHAAKHLWRPLRMLADVAQLTRACGSLAWPRVRDLAESAYDTRVLLVSLLLAHELLGAAVPPELLDQAMRDPAVRALARKVAASLFDPEEQVPEQVRGAARSLRTTPLSERAACGWRAMVGPTKADWRWVRLPDRAYCLYYLLRPLRLLLARAGLLAGDGDGAGEAR